MESYKDLVFALENKINTLAKNDLNLEESLKLYEDAMGIYVKCSSRLKEAEATLVKIKENADGELSKEPFEMAGE